MKIFNKSIAYFSFLLLISPLFGSSSFSTADLVVLYARKVEFFPELDFPDRGRFQLLETNRSLSQWHFTLPIQAKTLSLRDFIREIYQDKAPPIFSAEIIFSGKKHVHSLPLHISAPYYNRFSNSLTFEYKESGKEKLRFDQAGKEVKLIISLKPKGVVHEN